MNRFWYDIMTLDDDFFGYQMIYAVIIITYDTNQVPIFSPTTPNQGLMTLMVQIHFINK